ncbi:hypothetical protein KJ819_02050 [Patescibacteria group bacterium]|nr:hypothetical protein [Patescibacteria group bacterium]MBU1500934.1 hypothetical protein [Patescibacteria group bacterium]MBU2080565.1 hypothetical protein [Patescibacteria group bacterium]MBU2124359.1 hypothetical protein [Patescibacteria group bacterium]MBU2194486.1 hypothetical protein [Patescibacteria group bacterium]
MGFKKHPILYIILPLCVLAIAASFYRFMVLQDYIVTYEGACDPSAQSCYLACVDDSCSETYYYALVQKRSGDVLAQCGPDITDCEQASVCLESDRDCFIEYCDSSVDSCVGTTNLSPVETSKPEEI